MKGKLLFFAPLLALVMLVVCAVPALAVPPTKTTVSGLGTFVSGENSSVAGTLSFIVLATVTGNPTPGNPVPAKGMLVVTNQTTKKVITGAVEGSFSLEYDTEDSYLFGHCYVNRVKYYFEVLFWKSPAAKVDLWVDVEGKYTGAYPGSGFDAPTASMWYRGNLTKGCIQVRTIPPTP